MQRNADEKLVMERKGFSCGPCLSRFAESMTGCLTPVLLQPINTMAVNGAAMPVVAMRCRVAVFMTVFFPSLFAFVVGVDHVARDHHYDLFRRAARVGAFRVADVHAAATARRVLRIRRAGVDALIHGCLLGLVLGHLGPQQGVHVADFGFHRLCDGHHRQTHRTRRRKPFPNCVHENLRDIVECEPRRACNATARSSHITRRYPNWWTGCSGRRSDSARCSSPSRCCWRWTTGRPWHCRFAWIDY